MTILVVSQHDAVRRQLVDGLARSTRARVSGAACTLEAIREVHPQTLVLDLSQVDRALLRQVTALAAEISARLIVLASVHDANDERQVVMAGGAYLLKSVGGDALAGIVGSGSRAAAANAVAPTP